MVSNELLYIFLPVKLLLETTVFFQCPVFRIFLMFGSTLNLDVNYDEKSYKITTCIPASSSTVHSLKKRYIFGIYMKLLTLNVGAIQEGQ